MHRLSIPLRIIITNNITRLTVINKVKILRIQLMSFLHQQNSEN